jgi:rhodanese-related sulfurtransferase
LNFFASFALSPLRLCAKRILFRAKAQRGERKARKEEQALPCSLVTQSMRLVNFLRILLITAALSGYSAWMRDARPSRAKPLAHAEIAGIALLDRAAAESLWHDSTTLFVDVRSPIDYDFGHIAGAVSLPEEEFDKRFPDLKPRLEQARTIVVYCSNRACAKSLRVTIQLHQAGLTQTAIYPAGWNEWYLHELPIEGTGR